MTLQGIANTGGLWVPIPLAYNAAAPGYGAVLIDAAGEKAAFVIRAPKDGTLDSVEIRTGTVTSAPASGISISFQDVDPATGDPDGTRDQFRDVTTGLTSNTWIVPPGPMTSDGTNGGSKRTVSRGDILAVVIEFVSFGGADSLNIATFVIGAAPATIGLFPYVDQFTGAWAKFITGGPVMALKYSDGSYASVGINCLPASAFNTATYNSGSTPDERGLKFRLPFPAKIGGGALRVDLDGDADIVLYDSDGTSVLATTSLDKDIRSSPAAATAQFWFATPAAILANTFYRLVVKPTSVTSLGLIDFDTPSAAVMDAAHGGQDFHYTQRTDAGAWTDTTTKRALIALEITALDDGVANAPPPLGVRMTRPTSQRARRTTVAARSQLIAPPPPATPPPHPRQVMQGPRRRR